MFWLVDITNGGFYRGYPQNSEGYLIATSSYSYTFTTTGQYRWVGLLGVKDLGNNSGDSTEAYIDVSNFELSTGHPFYIQSSSGAYNAANALGTSDGVTNNGADRDRVSFTVPLDAPSTLYYVDENYSAMAGTIYTTDAGSGGGSSSSITNSTKTLDFDSSNNLQADTHLLPTANATYDLGSATQKWRDLYLDSASLHLGSTEISINASSELVLPAIQMTGHIIPDTNAQYDLGSAEYKIRHLYLSDNTIYSDSGNIKVAQHPVGGVPSTSTRLISTAKLKEIAAASPDYGAFQAAIAALEDN